MEKITSFRQLDTWQEAHKLVLMVYRVTQGYPADERFGLGYIPSDDDSMTQSETVGCLLNGLIASTERRP
jgi:hypothetical protein